MTSLLITKACRIARNAYECIDHMWHYLGSLQGCDGLHFNLLFNVKYILLLPHGNTKE